MQKSLLILLLVFYSTANASENKQPSMSNENTKRMIENFTEKPQKKTEEPQKCPFPHTIKPTITNVKEHHTPALKKIEQQNIPQNIMPTQSTQPAKL